MEVTMADALQVLMTRRSVREFLGTQLSDDEVKTIVDAGLHAATAMNRQSWHFTVVQDRRLLDAISGAVGAVMVDSGIPSLIERARTTGFSCFHHAPTVIFVSSDGSHYSLADCANASQNMCLAATALGLGSCYIGSFVQAFDHPSGKHLLAQFGLPDNYKPVFSIALGHAAKAAFTEKEREWKVSYIR
jgi:nitroreductase